MDEDKVEEEKPVKKGPKPGAFIAPVRVPSLFLLCLDQLADNLEDFSLDMLSEDLCIELLSVVLQKANLNPKTISVFLAANHASINKVLKSVNVTRALPPTDACR